MGAPRRRPTGALLVALPVFLALSLLPARPAAAEDPRDELQRVVASLERLQSWLDSSRRDRSELDAELRASARALSDLARQVSAAEQDLAAARDALDTLRERVAGLQARTDAQRAALAEQLRSAWLIGRQQPIQILFNADSPDRVGRLLTYHRHVSEARQHAIEDYQASLTELRTLEPRLQADEEDVRRRRDALLERQAELASARSARAELLASLDADISAGEGRLAELQSARERLAGLIAELEARRRGVPASSDFAAARGQLPWPLTTGALATAFGDPVAQGKLRSDGVFLRAAPGSPVQAVYPGRVVFADWMRGFGMLVILDHGDGYMSLYAQTESLLRDAGDWVEAGEPIATAGSSESATGIYFEIRHEGQPQDPGQWCAPARG